MVSRLKDFVKKPFPTSQVGQYPRPSWYQHSIGLRDFQMMMGDLMFREAYTDAAREIILDQIDAGLEIVCDGCIRYDKLYRVASWSTNCLCYFGGVKPVHALFNKMPIIESIITREVAKAAEEISGHAYPTNRQPWRHWVVESDLDVGKLHNWVETFKVAQSLTDRPLKFVGPSAAMATVFASNGTTRNDRDIYFQFFRVLNKILKELVTAGCRMIQLDYPFGLTHWAANKTKVSNEIWSDLIDAANEEIKGVNAHISYHFCFGAPLLWGPQAPKLTFHMAETYKKMGESKAHLLQSEAANTRGAYLDKELKAWKEHCPEKEVAIGAVTPYNGLETVEDVVQIIRKAAKYVPKDKLLLTTDEGLAAHGNANRFTAKNKMKLLTIAAEIARRKL